MVQRLCYLIHQWYQDYKGISTLAAPLICSLVPQEQLLPGPPAKCDALSQLVRKVPQNDNVANHQWVRRWALHTTVGAYESVVAVREIPSWHYIRVWAFLAAT